MKKFALFLIFFPIVGWAACNSFEGRGGYSIFSNAHAREIYNYGAPTVEVEYARKLNDNVAIWNNLGLVWKHGATVELQDKTRLYLTTFSIGPKYIWSPNCSNFEVYIGAGFALAYLALYNTPSSAPNAYKWGFGGVVKLGALQHFCGKAYLNYFLDYYYQPFYYRGSPDLQGTMVDAGGLHVGIGLGFEF